MIDLRPITLAEAARQLVARFPRWAYSYDQLRDMCIAGEVRCIRRRVAGNRKRWKYEVRLADLLADFEGMERPQIKRVTRRNQRGAAAC